MIEQRIAATTAAFLLLAAWPSGAWAEHPYVGTWTMNVAESRYPPGEAPKQQVAIITETGEGLEHRILGIAADGRRISAHIIIPETSGEGKVLEGPNYDAVSVKWYSPRERDLTYMSRGKVVNTVHSSISEDGKHMRTDSHGINARGGPTEGHAVYDRQ